MSPQESPHTIYVVEYLPQGARRWRPLSAHTTRRHANAIVQDMRAPVPGSEWRVRRYDLHNSEIPGREHWLKDG